MSQRSFKEWHKFAFKLFVSGQWEKISARVENGDETYRWVKEQVIIALGKIASECFRQKLGSAASNLKDRITSMKHSSLSDSDYQRVHHWMKRMEGKYVLKQEDEKVQHRVLGAKMALLEVSFCHYDSPNVVGREFCNVIDDLYCIEDVYEAIENQTNQELANVVKYIRDCAKEYADMAELPLEDWPEINFHADGSSPLLEFSPPDIWVFGDFGTETGQLYYPDKVVIDAEGNYLVMDSDVIGENTVQRIQLFDQNGKFLKIVLQRGEGQVNGMNDFCLNKDGHIIVIDSIDIDIKEKGRVQIFDYEGNRLLERVVDEPETYPRLTSCCMNEDGDIICFDFGRQCICIFSENGEGKAKFGKWGRNNGEFFGNPQTVCAFDGKIYTQGELMTQVFDYQGNFLRRLDTNPSASQLIYDAKSSRLFGVANHRVDIIDLDGNVIKTTGKFGSGFEEFWHPHGIALMAAGSLAVADTDNHRIKVFTFH